MYFATYLSLEMKFCDKSVVTELLKLLNKTGFEIENWKKDIFSKEFVFDKIIEIMSHDKKMSAGKVDFILPFKTLGEVKIESLDLNFIKNMLIKWSKGE
jgi:3-dehydroquinate synthetase